MFFYMEKQSIYHFKNEIPIVEPLFRQNSQDEFPLFTKVIQIPLPYSLLAIHCWEEVNCKVHSHDGPG